MRTDKVQLSCLLSLYSNGISIGVFIQNAIELRGPNQANNPIYYRNTIIELPLTIEIPLLTKLTTGQQLLYCTLSVRALKIDSDCLTIDWKCLTI